MNRQTAIIIALGVFSATSALASAAAWVRLIRDRRERGSSAKREKP